MFDESMEIRYRYRNIEMLVLLVMVLLFKKVESQLVVNSTEMRYARDLDMILQNYAFRAFVTPDVSLRTGVSYDGNVPGNLTGVRVSGLRLRSGSLFNRGVRMYKEFSIPIGVIELPYVERVVFVYQNLGNLSTLYYSLPGYTFLAPVLGLLVYDGFDLSAENLPELDILAAGGPISIDFEQVRQRMPGNSTPMCVWIDLNGLVNFTNLLSGNRCLTFKQGHFSIVVNSTSHSFPVSPSPSPLPPVVFKPSHKNGGIDSSVWVIVGSVVGGCLLLVLLAFLVLWIRGFKRRKQIHKMEKVAENGEPFHMTTIGGMKAPAAMVTRTQPTLETEYTP